MTDDTSNSEDENDRLKEALDGNFLSEVLYKNNSSEKKSEIQVKPSLRGSHKQIETVNPLSIKVTPEFQKHVSRHLARILDELIDDSQILKHCKKIKKKRNTEVVKLLRTSKSALSLQKSEGNVKVPCAKTSYLKNSMYEKRAKQVAVSGEWVLSQEGTKNWAQNTKGVLEVVTLKDFNLNEYKCAGKKNMCTTNTD